jgi:hypothetical protein
MSNGKSEKLFSEKFIKLILLSRELNEHVRFRTDFYFHPQQSGNEIVVKTIDLFLVNPLCKFNNEPQGNRWEERWIEAYLINRAKENNWRLEIDGKTYRFLASQFTFQKRPEWDGPKHVDLLLYDQDKNLVILEIKADSASFPTAIKELQSYNKELKRLFIEDEDEKAGALKAYDLEVVKDVIGYIVYPSTREVPAIKPEDYRKYDPFGLIEYDKPWGNSFDQVKEFGRTMRIKNFILRKPVGYSTEEKF